MEREQGTTYESTGGFGQQAIETEQPSLTERATGIISGKTTEPRYQSQYGTTELETGSLADSMRSTLSTRGGIGKYEEQKQPTMGEKIKGVMTGRSAEEQHAYEQGGRGYEQGGRGYEQGGRGTGYESSRDRSGYAGGGRGGGGQPTIIERVEATLSGRTPQEQHEHNITQRQERDMERSRGPSSSQPGMMASFGSMVSSATQGMFGTSETGTMSSHKTLKQKMMDSMNEIRTSLTGRTGDTSSYTGSTTYGGTQRRTGTGY